jgi:hypothetical protein
MWARIVSQYDMGHIPEPLVKVNIRSNSGGAWIRSTLDPLELERQWRMLGDKIVAYFPKQDQSIATQGIRRSGFNALTTCATEAFAQQRWRRGHEFFLLARRYTNLQTWMAMYVKSVLRVVKHMILPPVTQT